MLESLKTLWKKEQNPPQDYDQQSRQLAKEIAGLEDELQHQPDNSDVQKTLMLTYNRALSIYAKNKSHWQDIDALFLQIDNLRNIIRRNIQEQRMTVKELLIEADTIQVGVVEPDWQRVIKLAARPLETKGSISAEYSQVVIDNTLNHGAYYTFDEGITIPHARPECGVRRNCFSLVVLKKPIPFADSEKADIAIMLSARGSNVHVEEGIRSIVALLNNNDTMVKLRTARSREEVIALL